MCFPVHSFQRVAKFLWTESTQILCPNNIIWSYTSNYVLWVPPEKARMT